uniref:Uncharacterized protein n=1 Tax=Haemonchus placei TaxID=6290 RepID=A0A0N4X0N6_HAEPC
MQSVSNSQIQAARVAAETSNRPPRSTEKTDNSDESTGTGTGTGSGDRRFLGKIAAASQAAAAASNAPATPTRETMTRPQQSVSDGCSRYHVGQLRRERCNKNLNSIRFESLLQHPHEDFQASRSGIVNKEQK